MRTSFRVGGLIFAAVVILAVPITALALFQGAAPEVQLGLVIILSVVLLMVLLFIMAAGFKTFELADPKQALGLPEGTIRALIALILIMLFVITGIYLFRTVGEGVVTVRDLSQEQVRALGPRVVSSRQAPGGDTFTVTLQGSMSDEGARLAQQLVTTVGTLVVAVAGFYFGTSAVTAATSAVKSAAPLAITSRSPLPAGRIGQPYVGHRFGVAGGTPPYSWKLLAGSSYPPGLEPPDASSGEIRGTPTGPGGPFQVQVEDGANVTATKEFQLPLDP